MMPLPQTQKTLRWFWSQIMEELQLIAQHPLWHDGEKSRGQYLCPIPATPWKAGLWSLRSWKSLAARHIVVFGDKRYTILEGILEGELHECHGIWCAKSPRSHIGPYLHAIDFLVPDGTPVLAAQNGRVERFHDENNVYGDSSDFRDKVNFIDIIHAYGEVTEYCHLAKGSVHALGIKVGDYVTCGQVIAKVGMTGWTDRDHLHFIVLRDDEGNPDNPLEGVKFKSLGIRFL